jgi:lambda family phage tail tape measure protein
MATIEDFVLRMKVEGQGAVKQVSGSIQNLKDDISDLAQQGGPLGGTINGIIGKLGPMGVAASLAATAFVGLGAKALQLAGDLSDISGATGIAAGTLMNFRQSVIEAGGKAEDFSILASKLSMSVAEAASGNEGLQKSFKSLGVFITDVNGKARSNEDILRDLTIQFQNGGLSADQMTAATDILGKTINRLDKAMLNADPDIIKDEHIKQIDAYNTEIDKLQRIIGDKLITVFGEMAKAVNDGGISGGLGIITEALGNLVAEFLNVPTDAIAGILNLFGANIQNPVGLGTPVKKLVEQAKKDRLAFQAETVAARKAKEEADKLARQNNPKPLTATQGGFGPQDEAALKKAAEEAKKSADKIATSQEDQERLRRLTFNNEQLQAILMFADKETAIRERTAANIRDIEIERNAEIEKARIDLLDGTAAKQKEFANKRKEIELKADLDIAKATGQMVEALAREEERIQSIITQSKARVVEEQKLNQLLDARNKFVNENVAATDLERKRAEELFNLEQERLRVLREISLIKDLPENERLAREKEINAIFDQRRQKTVAQQEADKQLQENFGAGFNRAYRQYVEDSRNAFERAGRLFSTITKGMEDEFINFAKTGKFEFQNFLNTILEELLRSQVRSLIAQTLGGGGGGRSGGIKGFLGFANGGIIPTNGPVIVGERGPELLIGASGNRVVPNGQFGGGAVTYNINAVDARSFKDLVASDPSFIHAVAMAGGKNVPTTRR